MAEAGQAIGQVHLPKWGNEAQTAAEEQAVRLSVVKGRPFGEVTWQARITKKLRLESAFRPTGRPQKPKPAVNPDKYDCMPLGSVGVLVHNACKTTAAENTANDGIYEFTSASGKTYVGQSGNIATRIDQHLAS